MFAFALLLTAALVGVDQFTKILAQRYLASAGSIVVMDGVLNLTLVENRGAAFGIMQGGRWFFIILTFFVMGFIIFYYRSLPKGRRYVWVRLSLLLIAAGAVGNFIDRLRNGYVVDFFHVRFIDFPVFNMADVYVVTGTFLLTFMMLFIINKEGGQALDKKPADDDREKPTEAEDGIDKDLVSE